MTEPTAPKIHDRRTFLAGALALAVAACSDADEQSADQDVTTSSTATASGDDTGGEDTGGEDTAGDTAEEETAGDDGTTATDDGSTGDDGGDDSEDVARPLEPAMFDALPLCVLTPATTAGPFPSPELLERRDITEGYPGHPLRLGIRVVDRDCQPIPGAAVDIWHADASGDYSAFSDNGSGKDEGEGTNFCRGYQVADDNGIVEFQTIYPGWYEGRAVHIHLTAYVDGQPTLTTQMYFDETYTNTVYGTGEYAQFGPPDTGWADDRLIGDPAADGTGIVLAAAETDLGTGTLGLINIATA